MATPATPPPQPPKYSRAACLFIIAQTALFQLRQDADGAEQEDLAISSRLQAITAAVMTIEKNDPLLK